MSDKLNFYLNNEFQIIDRKLIKSDLNHDLIVIGNDTIQLQFGQWRSGESIEYSLYLTSFKKISPSISVFYQPRDRQIVDGDITLLRYTEEVGQELITDKLGKPAKKAAYILFMMLTTVSIIIMIVILISNPVGFTKRKLWQKNYKAKYREFIETNFKNDALVKRFINDPKSFHGWNKFDGKKFPSEWGLDFEIEKTFNLITTELIFLLLIIVQTIILIDVFQLFP